MVTILKATVSKRNFNNLLSDLYLALEEFLLWIEFKGKKQEFEIQKIKLAIWKARGLKQWYNKDLENIIDKKKKNTATIWTPLEILQLADANYYQSDAKKYSIEHNSLQEAMNQLDLFYATLKLKYSSELVGRSDVLGEKNTILLINEVEELSQHIKPSGLSLLDLYYNLVRLKKTSEDYYFQRLSHYLHHFSFADKKEQLTLLLYLANFGISKLKKGDNSAFNLVFELYLFGLQENIMTINHEFPPIPFKNIIAICCQLKKYDWGKSFIEKWSPFLPLELKEDTSKLCKAAIYFAEKDYEQCLLTLREASFKNFLEDMERRSLIIRSLYELKDVTAANDACTAFEQYLRRSKDAGVNFVMAGLNFIKLMKKIITSFDREQILKEMQEMEFLHNRSWFERKAN